MDYKATIQKIIYTLEGVKAEGSENWNRLLACTQELHSMLENMKAEIEVEVQEN